MTVNAGQCIAGVDVRAGCSCHLQDSKTVRDCMLQRI